MTPKKIRKLRAVINSPGYYNARLDQMSELFGHWTMLNLVADKHDLEKSDYWYKRWLRADKMRSILLTKMNWYINKLENFWDNSFDYET